MGDTHWRHNNYAPAEETTKKHWRGFSAGIKFDKAIKSPPFKRSSVWRFNQRLA